MSQKLVFHQSKCICAIKCILSTTAMYVSSSSFKYLRFPCYCSVCLNSSDLRVGLKTLLNTIQLGVSIWDTTQWVGEQCSRRLGAMARHTRDSVSPLWQNSAGWVPALVESLSAGVGCRYPVTVRKASVGSMRWVWGLRHQTRAPYSGVEWTRARVKVGNIVAPAPESASHLKSAMPDVNFCEVTWGVGNTWATCPTLLPGIWVLSRRAGLHCCSWLLAHI